MKRPKVKSSLNTWLKYEQYKKDQAKKKSLINRIAKMK